MSKFLKIEEQNIRKVRELLKNNNISFVEDSPYTFVCLDEADCRINNILDDYNIPDEKREEICEKYTEKLAEEINCSYFDDDFSYNKAHEFFEELNKKGELNLSEYEK